MLFDSYETNPDVLSPYSSSTCPTQCISLELKSARKKGANKARWGNKYHHGPNTTATMSRPAYSASPAIEMQLACYGLSDKRVYQSCLDRRLTWPYLAGLVRSHAPGRDTRAHYRRHWCNHAARVVSQSSWCRWGALFCGAFFRFFFSRSFSLSVFFFFFPSWTIKQMQKSIFKKKRKKKWMTSKNLWKFWHHECLCTRSIVERLDNDCGVYLPPNLAWFAASSDRPRPHRLRNDRNTRLILMFQFY